MIYKKIPDIIELNSNYSFNKFINSDLVEVPNDCGILIEMKYPILGMKNSINKCLVRKEVLDRLLEAKKYLPKGITFKIWDAYRPFDLQKEIFCKYKKEIINIFELQNLSEKEQNKIISNYVSLPIEDENIPPLHTTGGSIDLTLAYIDTKEELDLGVNFDEFSNLTKSSIFENKGMNKSIRRNRRILYWAMIKAGFSNLPSEIWHYDYGNRAWAFYNNTHAIYKGIFKIK